MEENTFSILEALSQKSIVGSLSLNCLYFTCNKFLFLFVPPEQAFTARRNHTGSKETNRHHVVSIPDVRMKSTQTTVSQLQPLCGTDSCICALLNFETVNSRVKRFFILISLKSFNLCNYFFP